MKKNAVINQHTLSATQKVVMFGGTFNPIHEGHISLFCQAFHEIHPEKIILVPTGIPQHKKNNTLVSTHNRLSMCKLAIREYPFVEIDDYELRIANPCYTVDTLFYIKRRFPNAHLYLLMGTDVFLKFDMWYKWRICSKLATLLVGSRYIGDEHCLTVKQQSLNLLGVHSQILQNRTIQESSTRIRQIYSDNKDIIHPGVIRTLNLDVQNYILKQGLYQSYRDKIT